MIHGLQKLTTVHCADANVVDVLHKNLRVWQADRNVNRETEKSQNSPRATPEDVSQRLSR